MAEYTPFKMKGRPMIQGTNTHSSALKQKESDINALLEKRNKLKEKEEKVESKNKKTKLGKWLQEKKLKRIDKRQEKVQEEIDENPTAQKWRKDGEKKIEQETNTLPPSTPVEEEKKTETKQRWDGTGNDADKKKRWTRAVGWYDDEGKFHHGLREGNKIPQNKPVL